MPRASIVITGDIKNPVSTDRYVSETVYLGEQLTGIANPPTGEPFYIPGVSTLIFAGNSSSPLYADLTAMGALPYGDVARLVPSPAPASPEGSSPVDPVTHAVVTGMDGAGKGIWIKYPPISSIVPGTTYQTGGRVFLYRVPGTIGPTSTVVMQWYVKMTGAIAELFRYKHAHIYLSGIPGGGVPQWSTAAYAGGGSLPGSPHTVYQFYGKAYEVLSPDRNQGDQPFGPYLQDAFDDVWRRKTISYRQHDSPSVKNGHARMWIDGVKIMDVCQATVGVTPTGGGKTWCEQNHIDNGFHDGLNFMDASALSFWGGTITSENTTTQGEIINIGDGDPETLTTLKVWSYEE